LSVEIKLSGILTKRGALMTLGAEMQKRLDAEVARAAVNTANNARSAVQAGGSGITYDKYNPRRTHQASAPRQPPATDTGRLVSSITQSKQPDGWLVGSKVNYSKWLEFGTIQGGGHIEERPFFRPALAKARKEWRERVINLVGAKKVRLEEVIK